MVWEAFKRFGCWDRGGGGGLPHLIPYPSISLFSNPGLQHWAPLIASTFSKGRSISSGRVAQLCLILFCVIVVARELTKEHLITVTCCRWLMLNQLQYCSSPHTHAGSWNPCVSFREPKLMFSSILTVVPGENLHLSACDLDSSLVAKNVRANLTSLTFSSFMLIWHPKSHGSPKLQLKCQLRHLQDRHPDRIPTCDLSSAAHRITCCVS